MAIQQELKEPANRASSEAEQKLSAWIESRKFSLARNIFTLIICVSGAAVWFLSLGRMDVGSEGLPWYIILGLMAVNSVRFLKMDDYAELAIVGLPKSKEPLKLKESLAMVFLVAAAAIYVIAGISMLRSPEPIKRSLQIIDIQLLSEKDYQNNNALLPGMKPQDSLRERKADLKTQQGDLSNASPAKTSESADNSTKEKPKEEAKSPQKQEKKDSQAPKSDGAEHSEKSAKAKLANKKSEIEQKSQDAKSDAELSKTGNLALKNIQKQALKNTDKAQTSNEKQKSDSRQTNNATTQQAAPVVIPGSWQTKTVNQSMAFQNRPIPSKSSAQSDQPFLQEVRPLEMVEMIENEGENDGIHVFQRGGKSSGGKGAENDLNTYLKALHKRIKSNWSPPRGFTRKVEVIFRLKRDGHLAQIRVIKSSGEDATDKAAIKAIVAATKKAENLPTDFISEFLDVMYTFKYNVDELQEVPQNQEPE